MINSLKITCPTCNRNTKAIALKFIAENELTEIDHKIIQNKNDLITPRMYRHLYKQFHKQFGNNPTLYPTFYKAFHEKSANHPSSGTVMSTISRIPPHNKALFKDKCEMSDRIFKIFYYLFLHHDTQEAGITFKIGQEIM